MYKTLAGYHIKPKARFSHWEVLLDAWIEIHEHYSVATKDAGYWYTERTNVGILAQAAWKSGFIALEEYQTKKMARHDPNASSNGRCDLWISGKKVSDVIEAKQQYIQLGSSRNTAVANSHLKKALADATRTVGDSGEDAVGLVFLPAYFSAQETQPRGLAKEIARSTDLLSLSTADVVAWCFPGESRAFKGRNEINYIPGLFMVASVTTSE